MKKLFFLLAAVFAVVACETPAPSQQNETPIVDNVVVTPATCEVLIGETIDLDVVVTPENYASSVQWLSTNPDVATVDNGTVKGVASGTAIIMAQAGNKTGSCTVNVVGTPVESISIDKEEIYMTEGDVYTLRATVLPETADNKSITWSSSNESIATVNGSGTVTAHKPGDCEIYAKAGNCTAECHVSIDKRALAIGDYYYADGTWSAQLDAGRTPIGVVFYVGDVTEFDPALKNEHPNCTHGLVVSLTEHEQGTAWQPNYEKYSSTIGMWCDAFAPQYECVTSGYELEDNLNRPIGYNNTKAMELFNAAEDNAEWQIEPINFVVDYRTKVPAPEASSDWYLPSAKELSLLMSGEYDKNIWDIRDSGISVENVKDINKKMEKIESAIGIGKRLPGVLFFYWSSTEVSWEYAITVVNFNGQTPQALKRETGLNFNVRPILAF